MKLWIRVDACTPRDPKVGELADRLGVSVPLAVGHLVMLWGVMAEHTPDGVLSAVGVRPLEQWAGWTGKRGKFYEAFCDLFVTDGVVGGWEKRQGALISRMEKDRQRKFQGNSTEVPKDSAPTERNGTEQRDTAASVDVDRVLAHYVACHPKRRPGESDRRLVRRRIEGGFSADVLCDAITGNKNDPWHASKKKHELGYVLREGKIYDFAEKAQATREAATSGKDYWDNPALQQAAGGAP